MDTARKTGIPGFENESILKQEKELRRMYRTVFSSEEGKIVLATLLEELCFFRECKTEEEQTLNNFAKHLIQGRLGIVDNLEIIKKLFEASSKEL